MFMYVVYASLNVCLYYWHETISGSSALHVHAYACTFNSWPRQQTDFKDSGNGFQMFTCPNAKIKKEISNIVLPLVTWNLSAVWNQNWHICHGWVFLPRAVPLNLWTSWHNVLRGLSEKHFISQITHVHSSMLVYTSTCMFTTDAYSAYFSIVAGRSLLQEFNSSQYIIHDGA